MGTFPRYPRPRVNPNDYRGTDHYESGKTGRTRRLGMENIVRPFVTAISTPKTRERQPPDLTLPEAHIRWGKASDYTLEEFKEIERRGFQTDDSDDEEPERVRVSVTEEGRAWRDFRVENPDDPEMYAIIRTTEAASYRYPSITLWGGPAGNRQKFSVSGAQFLLQMRAASAIPNAEEEGSGQTPEAPPSLEEME